MPEKNWLPIERGDVDLNIIMRLYSPDLEKYRTWPRPRAEKLKGVMTVQKTTDFVLLTTALMATALAAEALAADETSETALTGDAELAQELSNPLADLMRSR